VRASERRNQAIKLRKPAAIRATLPLDVSPAEREGGRLWDGFQVPYADLQNGYDPQETKVLLFSLVILSVLRRGFADAVSPRKTI